MKKTLIALTTYNGSDITKKCLDALSKIDRSGIDVIVVDDCSTDNTKKLVSKYDFVEFIGKEKGVGLTDSWNIAYQKFKNDRYQYLIVSNNDVLIPRKAIDEMEMVLVKWPGSLVVPLTTQKGCGHNKIQSIHNFFEPDQEFSNPLQYENAQNLILDVKEQLKSQNNLYQLDPVRMKMFNGFFFMMSRNVIKYELEDSNLFYQNVQFNGNEDEFNWGTLIPNNDFPFLCKTAFVYHFKGYTKKNI